MDEQEIQSKYLELSEQLVSNTPDKFKNFQFLINSLSQTLSEVNKVLLDKTINYDDRTNHLMELSINLSGISLTTLGLINQVSNSDIKPNNNFKWSTNDFQLISTLNTLVNNHYSRIKRGMSILDSLDQFYYEYSDIQSPHKDNILELSIYDFYKNQCILNYILDYDYWYDQSVKSLSTKKLVRDKLKESTMSNNIVDKKYADKIIRN